MTKPKTAEEASRRLAVVPDSVCSCKKCQGMCEARACWATPAEAQAIIDAGLGHRLMRDWWCGSPIVKKDDDYNDTSLLVPAQVGHEGQDASSSIFPKGRCTFLSDDGLCFLHDLGLKPSEGRKAIHSPEYDKLGEDIHTLTAATGATAVAQNLVAYWKRTVK